MYFYPGKRKTYMRIWNAANLRDFMARQRDLFFDLPASNFVKGVVTPPFILKNENNSKV